MKTIISILVFVGAFAGVRYLVEAVVTNEQVRQVNNRANDPKSEPVVSAADVRSEFMKGCDTGEYSGANFDQSAYCGCVYDKIEAQYGVNYIIKSGLNDSSEDMQTKFAPQINQCLAEQGI